MEALASMELGANLGLGLTAVTRVMVELVGGHGMEELSLTMQCY